MSTEQNRDSNESLMEEPAPFIPPKEQRRKAGQLLIRLQWLIIILLIAAMLWLFYSQERFEQEVLSRLQTNEQVTARLNAMDDRLYAISQQTLAPQQQIVGSQAQNQLDLLKIQLHATNRLIDDSNFEAGISLLRGLLWQLSQDTNEIAPALTIVLKQSLTQDIERLQAQSTQPSPWQLHNLAIADIQAYLRRQVSSANRGSTKLSNVQQYVAYDVQIHEVIMTLNLAMQASNMHDKALLLMYLQQAKSQLTTLQQDSAALNSATPSLNSSSKTDSNQSTSQRAQAEKDLDGQQDKSAMGQSSGKSQPVSANKDIDNLASLADAIEWLDKLIAEAPKSTPLLTSQVLDTSLDNHNHNQKPTDKAALKP